MNLTDIALDRPVATAMGLVCILVLGTLSIFTLPLEFLPSFSSSRLWIRATYSSSSPAEVERLITLPLEEALGSLEGLESIRSTSSGSGANVTLELTPGVDMDLATMDVRERLDRARPNLPADVERIWVRRFQSTDIPVINISVAHESEPDLLFPFVDEELKPALERLPGVASVEVSGLRSRQLRVEADVGRLRALGLTAADLRQTLIRNHLSRSAGAVQEAGRRAGVWIDGEMRNPGEFARLPVVGTGLSLGEVARVRYDYPPVEEMRRLDGSEAVTLRIYKSTAANLVEVANGVNGTLKDREPDAHARGFRLLVYRDRSEDVRKGLRDLARAGLIGGCLAVLFLFVFLRDLSSTLIIGATVPLSMVCAARLMMILRRLGVDVTLNIVSLMGAVLAVGMVVDNAVVVLENIYRYRVKGIPLKESARRGAAEVRTAILAATLTSVCVFLPMILVDAGRMGIWMEAFGLTICVALIASLALALSLVPLVAGHFDLGSGVAREPVSVRWLGNIYGRWVRWSLRHRFWTMVATLGALGGSIWLFGQIDREYVPSTPARRLSVVGKLWKSAGFTETLALAKRLENLLTDARKSFDLKNIDARLSKNEIRLELYLQDEEEATVETMEAKRRVQKLLPELPGVEWKMERLRHWQGTQMGVGIELYGPSPSVLELLASEVKKRLQTVKGIEDIDSSLEKGQEEVRLEVDRDNAARLGLTASELARTVAFGVSERPVGSLVTRERDVPILIGMHGGRTVSLKELLQTVLPGSGGKPVPLGAVLRPRLGHAAKERIRLDRRNLVTVFANTSRRGMYRVGQEIESALSDLPFPPGYGYSLGDSYRRMQQSESGFGMALMLAVLLIYVIMASLFESFIHPLTILLSVPFAFIGVALTFYITGTTLSSMGWLGLMVLSGIVVNNAIVFLDLAQQLRREGLPAAEAVPLAGELRLRPILLTALTTILGLLPMTAPLLFPGLFGPLEGRSRMWAPVGLALMGGLTTSTILTLIVIPTIYTLLDDLSAMFLRVFRKLAIPSGTRSP